MGTIIWPWHISGATGANDPHFANTVLLLSGDGINGADANEPDLSFANRGNGGSGGAGISDAIYVTSTFLSGTGSVRFDNSRNDFVDFGDHADWTFGTSNFTVEGFFYHAENTVTEAMVSHYNATTTQRGWLFDYRGGDATDTLRFVASPDGSNVGLFTFSGNWTPTVDTWYYYCVERSGNTFRIYAGVPGGTANMIATATSSIDIHDAAATLRWGDLGNASVGFYGYMDERRITLGVARYATDAGYPVPVAPFPRS